MKIPKVFERDGGDVAIPEDGIDGARHFVGGVPKARRLRWASAMARNCHRRDTGTKRVLMRWIGGPDGNIGEAGHEIGRRQIRRVRSHTAANRVGEQRRERRMRDIGVGAKGIDDDGRFHPAIEIRSLQKMPVQSEAADAIGNGPRISRLPEAAAGVHGPGATDGAAFLALVGSRRAEPGKFVRSHFFEEPIERLGIIDPRIRGVQLQMEIEADLALVINADGRVRRRFGFRERRQKKAREDGNYSDDHQKLDQGKRSWPGGTHERL